VYSEGVAYPFVQPGDSVLMLGQVPCVSFSVPALPHANKSPGASNPSPCDKSKVALKSTHTPLPTTTFTRTRHKKRHNHRFDHPNNNHAAISEFVIIRRPNQYDQWAVTNLRTSSFKYIQIFGFTCRRRLLVDKHLGFSMTSGILKIISIGAFFLLIIIAVHLR
jgi:hypothetical protein